MRPSSILTLTGMALVIFAPVLELQEVVKTHLVLGLPGGLLIVLGLIQFFQEDRPRL